MTLGGRSEREKNKNKRAESNRREGRGEEREREIERGEATDATSVDFVPCSFWMFL